MSLLSKATPQSADEKKRASQRIFFMPTERFVKTLGNRISVARRKRRLKQSEMAERALMSESTYRRIEKGDSTVSVAALMRVLFILGGLNSFNEILLPINDRTGIRADGRQAPQANQGQGARTNGIMIDGVCLRK